MSWLEGKWPTQTNGNARVFVAAVTSAGVVGVEVSGAVTFMDARDLRGWAVQDFQDQLAD
jgi:hypothetical protein